MMGPTILLMRHAEEPRDPKNVDLSAAGRLRAERLAIFVPNAFGRPDFLFAAAPNRLSVRSYLTLRPLSFETRARVETSFKSRSSVALATRLLSDITYANKLVAVCWTHMELPSFAGALHAPSRDYPDPWDETVFNLILQFDFKRPDEAMVTKVIQPF
jgi:hypothetical protein